MKDLLNRNKIDIGIITFILLTSFLIRVLWLDIIPTNISGDEVTNLSDVYKILFGKGYSFFSFMGDGSVAGINFYWSALFLKVLGLNHTIFALRFSVVIFSMLSLIPFYLLLREKTSRLIGFIFTSLLSANYVFLNFSRTAWINMGIIFSGFFLILFLEKATKKGCAIWYILAGVFAGITLYGYHYGRILVGSIFLYLLFRFFKEANRNFTYLRNFLIFSSVVLFIFSPFLISILSNKVEAVLRRPKATYAFAQGKVLSVSTLQNIFRHQVEYTFRGFLLLDGKVMSESIENMRYVPFHKPPVNIPIKVLFIIGLVYAIIFERRITLWWTVFGSIIITQVLSDLPPNFSRGLFYIPFIYFICGIFLYRICSHFKERFSLRKIRILILILTISGGLLFLLDVNYYLKWMKTDSVYRARQPAIDFYEFPIWQEYQIRRAKSGLDPITNYEWYEIRDSLLNK